MRHLFLCVDCGESFEKTDANTSCPDCVKKAADQPEKSKSSKRGGTRSQGPRAGGNS